MIGTTIERNEQGALITEGVVESEYRPPEQVTAFTLKVKEDYAVGQDILNRPFTEFNDMSLIDRMSADQKAWNAYVEPKTQDPLKKWMENLTTNTTRDKIVSTLAHLVAGMMYPSFFAQNDQDEEDRMMAEMMQDIVKWNIQNSNYEMTFLFAVLACLVNPVAYVKVDYVKAFQSIKERGAGGNVTTKQVIDEILSGLRYSNVPADELLIANPYEFYLQRQRFLGRKRWIDYDEAKALHGNHPNFRYVRPGRKTFFNQEDATFYDQFDENLETLCEEFTYYNRREDTEVTFINGIYLGNPNPEHNPMRHRDNRNKPWYPFVKVIGEPISENFFAGKSLAFKLVPNQKVRDKMWRMAIDGTFLEVMTPLAVTGRNKPGAMMMYPGAVTPLPDPNSNIVPLRSPGAVNSAWNAIGAIDQDMNKSSQDPQRAGISEQGDKTAYEVAKIEQNAKINLGIIGRMVVEMVRDLGNLTGHKVITHQTTMDLQETSAGTTELRYRTFLLQDEGEGGEKVTKKIKFEPSMIGKRLPKGKKEQKRAKRRKSFKIKDQQKKGQKIRLVNPSLFRRLKYLTIVEAESWQPRNERFETLAKLEVYDRAIRDPFADKRKVSQDFLFKPLMKGEASKYMIEEGKESIAQQLGLGEAPQVGSEPQQNKQLTKEALDTLTRE